MHDFFLSGARTERSNGRAILATIELIAGAALISGSGVDPIWICSSKVLSENKTPRLK
jgi:hypothetical protein